MACGAARQRMKGDIFAALVAAKCSPFTIVNPRIFSDLELLRLPTW